jgi:hypothetical protein
VRDAAAVSTAALSLSPELVSFRDLVPEITETTYLTHAVYYYPAKFIPQVVRFCLNTWTREGDWIIDPFAGSATVGLEALLCRRNAVLLDLNLLLAHIVPLKMSIKQPNLSQATLSQLLDEMRQSTHEFRPDWSNLDYWYPPDMLKTLSRYWDWQKQMPQTPYALIVEAALVKASKQFSYAEHKAPKLFKSHSKREQIARLLQSDWQAKLDQQIYDTAFDICRRVQQLARLLETNPGQVLAYSGVDSTTFSPQLTHEMDCLISSPPYLQAQEYIRTSKLDLYWLGHREAEIKRISKLEIPYRKANQHIATPTLNAVRVRLEKPELVAMLDSYFCYTLQALANTAKQLRVGGHACIFVGNPTVDGIEIETWRIIAEYFADKQFVLEHLYEDRIKNRQLFGGRKNKNPEGMKSEFLLVLSKQGHHEYL